METVKKTGKRRKDVVTVQIANGNPITPDVLNRRRDEEAWDVQWYNFQEKKWEREGNRLTYKQAYAAAWHRGKANPYAKIAVGLLPGVAPGVNSRTLNGSKVDA